MNEFDAIISEATAAIAEKYFMLPIYGGPPVYRERVYCYELYHQMRNRWPDEQATSYTLNGEVDKCAHVELEKLGVNGQKPDLLVHGPGDMGKNFAIIEVKHVAATPEGLRKDLRSLTIFRDQVGYQRAIYLIYGKAEMAAIAERVKREAAAVGASNDIELWLHVAVGKPAIFTMKLEKAPI